MNARANEPNASIDAGRGFDCVKCGYSLIGIPGDHRCPECGFGYQHAAIADLAAMIAEEKAAGYAATARWGSLAAILVGLALVVFCMFGFGGVIHAVGAIVLLVGGGLARQLTIGWQDIWRFRTALVLLPLLALTLVLPFLAPGVALILSTIEGARAMVGLTLTQREYPHIRGSFNAADQTRLRRYGVGGRNRLVRRSARAADRLRDSCLDAVDTSQIRSFNCGAGNFRQDPPPARVKPLGEF